MDRRRADDYGHDAEGHVQRVNGARRQQSDGEGTCSCSPTKVETAWQLMRIEGSASSSWNFRSKASNDRDWRIIGRPPRLFVIQQVTPDGRRYATVGPWARDKLTL